MKTPFPFAGIIFDMDGTLVDSEVIWREAEIAMFKDRGHIYTDEVREKVIGMRLDEFFLKLIEIFGLTETVEVLQQELIDRMLPLLADVEVKPGAQALIEYVSELGVPYCIASSSPQVIIDATVAAQGWQELIPKTYTADLVAHGKPAPDVYFYAAEQLGVAPEDCLVFEDSPAGATAAVAAGMTCYVVPDFHSDPSRFKEITPHVYKDLCTILEELRTQA